MSNLPTFTTPLFNITVPSTGKKTQMRSLLAKELKTFIILKENDDSKEVINSMLAGIKACAPSLDVDKLTLYDLEYLYLQLYVNSTAEKNVRIKYKCTHVIDEAGKTCEQTLGLSIPISEIKVKVDKKDFKLEKIASTGSKVILTFGHPKVNIIGNIDDNFDIIPLCLQTMTIGDQVYHAGTDFGVEYAKEVIDSFTLEELNTITGFFDNIPTVKYETDLKCTKCGTVHNIKLKGINDFFQ